MRGDSLDGLSAQECRMSIWCLPIEQSPHTTKCEICGREIEQLHSFGRICRSCLVYTPEKQAA